MIGTIASLPVASFAVGALTIGYGVYSLVNGVQDLINVYNSIDKHPVSSSTDYEVDAVTGAINITPSETNKSFYLQSSMSAIYGQTNANPNPDVHTTNISTFINDVSDVIVESYSTKLVAGADMHYIYLQLPDNLAFKFLNSDRTQYTFCNRILINGYLSAKESSVLSVSSTFYKAVNPFNGYISSSGSSKYEVSSPLGVTTSTSSIFNKLGIEVVDRDAYLSVSKSIEKSLILSSVPTLTIPQNHVQLANPDLVFENGNWVNKDGNVATDEEIKVFIPNTFNPSTGGLEWDSTYEGALGGTLNPPIEDVTPDDPTVGGNWLTAILNAITSLPKLIFEAFMELLNNILDGINAIPGVLNDIWSWCQDLPNFLSDCLSSFIEFLQSLGMTLSDILEFIISLPLTIVEMLVEGLVWVFDALFIPSDDFFKNNFEDIKDNFSSKFPIFLQFKDMFNSLKFNESSRPEINITLPEILGGGTYALIDYDVFDHFRPYLLNMLTLVFYFFFGMSMFRNLPNVISGGGGGSEDDS